MAGPFDGNGPASGLGLDGVRHYRRAASRPSRPGKPWPATLACPGAGAPVLTGSVFSGPH